jgi:hypothetical protein
VGGQISIMAGQEFAVAKESLKERIEEQKEEFTVS